MKWKLATVIALMSTSPAAAANWRMAAWSGKSPNRDMYFVDAASLRRSAHSVTFWLREYYETPSRMGTISLAELIDVDCGIMSAKYRASTSFHSDGSSFTDNTLSIDYAIPGTGFYAVLEGACRGKLVGRAISDPEGYAREFFKAN